MKPITTVYWLRVALGITSGLICAIAANFLYNMMGPDSGTNVLMYTISLTLLIYLGTFQVIKRQFQNKVDKPSKLTMTGIGMYFFSWLAFYVIFYTIIVISTGGMPL